MKHNKKRNTAVLYEILVRQLTKEVVEKNTKGKDVVLSIIKEFFKKGSVLNKEVELYKVLSESSEMDPYLAQKLIDKALQHYNGLDHELVFGEQTRLLKRMNKELPKSVYTNFIPNYKDLATISQLFSDSTPVKDKVLLENKILENLTSKPEEKQEMKVIDDLAYKTFVNKFNEEYGKKLVSEQKELITKFIMSFADRGADLSLFLNEELGRLKNIFDESKNVKEVKEDKLMLEKMNKVSNRIMEYSTRPVDKFMVFEILKMQELAKEVTSDGD